MHVELNVSLFKTEINSIQKLFNPHANAYCLHLHKSVVCWTQFFPHDNIFRTTLICLEFGFYSFLSSHIIRREPYNLLPQQWTYSEHHYHANHDNMVSDSHCSLYYMKHINQNVECIHSFRPGECWMLNVELSALHAMHYYPSLWSHNIFHPRNTCGSLNHLSFCRHQTLLFMNFYY